MSAEISMGSTATAHGPGWTTYNTMHAGQPHFNFVNFTPRPKQLSARPRFLPRVKPCHGDLGFLKGLNFDRKIPDSYKQVNS